MMKNEYAICFLGVHENISNLLPQQNCNHFQTYMMLNSLHKPYPKP
jgi:hypothetical protein